MRLFLLSLILAVAPGISGASILMRPYLQGLTPTSVCVLVEANSRDPITVEYGTTPLCGLEARTESIALTTASPVTYVHRIPLAGLRPETDYYYRAGEGGAFTGLSKFRTGALPGTPFRFIWVADGRSGPVVFDSIIARAAATGPLIGLYGGDLSRRPSYESWKNDFFREGQLELGTWVPWVNTPGNHEQWTSNTMAFTRGPVGSGPDGYFSFDCGDMHLLALNTQLPLGAGSPQYEFAANDLRSTNRRWKVVILHRPAYCAGGHGEDSTLIALTTSVLEPGGVDLVLCGHSHFYQHNLVHGIHHLVIGSAGAPLYDPASASYTVKSMKEYNWAVADVTGGSLSLFVYNEQGAPLDTLLLRK